MNRYGVYAEWNLPTDAKANHVQRKLDLNFGVDSKSNYSNYFGLSPEQVVTIVKVSAGGDAILKADGDISLLAARNTVETDRRNSNSSAGVGVAISVGQGGASVIPPFLAIGRSRNATQPWLAAVWG